LKRYTCLIDGYTVESSFEQDIWDHIDEKHGFKGGVTKKWWSDNIRVEEIFQTARQESVSCSQSRIIGSASVESVSVTLCEAIL